MSWKKLEVKQSESYRFEDDGNDTLEGTYLGAHEAKSKKGKPLTFYEFKLEKTSEVVSVLGSTVLDRIFSTQVEKGQKVLVEYKGEKEGKRGTYKDYEVSIWEE